MEEFENGFGNENQMEHLILPEGMDHKDVGQPTVPFGELEFLFTGFEDRIVGPTEKMPVAKRGIFLNFEISDTENHKFKKMKHRQLVIIGTDDDPNADGGPLKDMDLKKRTWKARFKPIRLFLEAARVAKNKDYTVMLNTAIGTCVVGTVQRRGEYRNIVEYFAVGTKPLRSLDDQGRPLIQKDHVVLASFAPRVAAFEND